MKLDELFIKTTFLLGAGASFEAGCLISKRMLSSLMPAINSIAQDDPYFGKYIDGFKDLYQVVRPALAHQVELKNIRSNVDGNEDLKYEANIEDFILVLRKIINRDYIIPEPLVGSWSDKLSRLLIMNPDLVEKFLQFIYQSVIRWITPSDNFSKAGSVLSPIKDFLTKTNDESYWINIFTLNYDLTIEKALNSKEERVVNTGFHQDIWLQNSFNIPDSKINLYKIHGSLDWFKDGDTACCMPGHDVAYNEKQPDELLPHLILGFENKLFSVDPFFTLVQKFIRSVDEANLIIVIGYSFFDAYLNNIIIQSLSRSYNKRLLIVDPRWAGKSPEEFVQYIKHVQTDKSSLNLDNYETLASSKVKVYKAQKENISGASAFYKEYFESECEKLKEEHSDLSIIENPF